jgi:hypothetical protein
MPRLLEISAQAGVFDAEQVCILTAAFDETWQAVQHSGAPFASNGEAEATRDLIALRIIAMARIENVMLDHVSLGVTDIDRSRRFYDAALRPLGVVRIVDFGKTMAQHRDPSVSNSPSPAKHR